MVFQNIKHVKNNIRKDAIINKQYWDYFEHLKCDNEDDNVKDMIRKECECVSVTKPVFDVNDI